MNDYYKKEYSWIMDREMEHAIFGDSGRLCVAFGPQNGHTYDFRNFGMVDTIAPWIPPWLPAGRTGFCLKPG